MTFTATATKSKPEPAEETPSVREQLASTIARVQELNASLARNTEAVESASTRIWKVADDVEKARTVAAEAPARNANAIIHPPEPGEPPVLSVREARNAYDDASAELVALREARGALQAQGKRLETDLGYATDRLKRHIRELVASDAATTALVAKHAKMKRDLMFLTETLRHLNGKGCLPPGAKNFDAVDGYTVLKPDAAWVAALQALEDDASTKLPSG
jgi:hypothetical protein